METDTDANSFDFLKSPAVADDPAAFVAKGDPREDIVPVSGIGDRELVPVKQSLDLDAPRKGGLQKTALDFLKKLGVAFSIGSALTAGPNTESLRHDPDAVTKNRVTSAESWEGIRFSRRKREIEDSSDGLQQSVPHYDKGGQVVVTDSDSGVFRKIKSIGDRLGSGVKSAAATTSKAVKKTATIFSIASALSGWGDVSSIAAGAATTADSSSPREVAIATHWLGHDRRRKSAETKESPKISGKIGDGVDDPVQHFDKGGTINDESTNAPARSKVAPLPKAKDFASDDQIEALRRYQNAGLYTKTNEFLRGTDESAGTLTNLWHRITTPKSTRQGVESIDSLMKSDAAVLPAMTVHRAMVIPEAGENNKNILDLIGKTISEPAFSSTSVRREATDNFMTREDRVRAEISVPERTKGLSLDPDDTGVESEWKNEKEVLVDRGAKYRVVDVFRGEDNRWNAKLELLSTRHGRADRGEEEKPKATVGDGGGRESEPVIHREMGGPIPGPAPGPAFKSDGEIPVHPDVPADADEVPIKAKAGEFVVRKEQAQKFKPVLEAINNDDIPRVAAVAADDGADHFERGGEVGEPKPKAKSSNGGAGVKSFFDFESDVAHLPPSVREKAYAHYTSQQAERGALTPDFVKEEFRENKPEDITQYRHARKERESGFQEARENWDEQRKERKYDKITQQFERDYPEAFDDVISAIKRDGLSNSGIIHQHLPEEFRDESSSGWISHLRASSRKAQIDEYEPLLAAHAIIPSELRSSSTPSLVKQMFAMNGGIEKPAIAVSDEPRAQSGENPSLSTDVKPAAPSPHPEIPPRQTQSQVQPADDWRSEWKRANAARASVQEQGGVSFADLQKRRQEKEHAALYAEAAARREAKRREQSNSQASDSHTFHKMAPQQSESFRSHIENGESVAGDLFNYEETTPKKSPSTRSSGAYDSPKRSGDDAAAKAELDATIARINKSRESERDLENKQRVFNTKSAIAKESGVVDFDDHFESVRGELNKVIDDVGQQPPLASGKKRYFHGGQKIDAGDDHTLDVFTPSVEEAAYAAMLAEKPVSYVDLDEEKSQNLSRNYHADPSVTQSSTVLFDTFNAKKKREDDTPVARSQFTPTTPQEPLPKRATTKKGSETATASSDADMPTALRADGIPGDSAPIATEAKSPAREEAAPRAAKPRSKRRGGRSTDDVKASSGGKDAGSPEAEMPTALNAEGIDADSAPIVTVEMMPPEESPKSPSDKLTWLPNNNTGTSEEKPRRSIKYDEGEDEEEGEEEDEKGRKKWRKKQRKNLSRTLRAGAYAADLISGVTEGKGPAGWGSTKEDGDFYRAVYGKDMPRSKGMLSGASKYLKVGASLARDGDLDWAFGKSGSKGAEGMLGGAAKAMRSMLGGGGGDGGEDSPKSSVGGGEDGPRPGSGGISVGGGEGDPNPGGGKGADAGKMVGKIATTAAKFAFPEAAPLIAMAEKTGIVDKFFSGEGGGMFGGGLGGALGGLLGGGDGKDGVNGKDESGGGEVAKLLRELIDIIKGQGKAGEQTTGYGNTQSHPSINMSIPGLINAIGLMANAPRG